MEENKTTSTSGLGKLLMGVVVIATLISIFFFVKLIIDSFTFR